MSGSPIIDDKGVIVSILTSGGNSKVTAVYFVPSDPFGVTKTLKEKYPDIVFYMISPEPSAIVQFLQNYCQSKTDSINFENTTSISKNGIIGLMRYGFDNNPPMSIEQLIHPRMFTKSGYRKLHA